MLAAMLDRDGTLTATGGYCHPDDLSLLPDAAPAIKLLNEHGFPTIVVSNQTGIGDGRFSKAELEQSTHRMLNQLAEGEAYIDAIYYCTKQDPRFGKPDPSIIFHASDEMGFDVEGSVLIGDSGYSDMVAASQAGCRSILVLSGWGKSSLTQYREDWKDIEPDFVCEGILEAAELVCANWDKQAYAYGGNTSIRIM